METLKQEHDRITKEYYQDRLMEKEEFDRLHTLNGLRQTKANGDFEDISEEEIDNRIIELTV